MATYSRAASGLAKPLVRIPAGVQPIAVVTGFMSLVNMSTEDIQRFFETPDCKQWAQGQEIEGPKLARRVIEILDKIGEKSRDPLHGYPLSSFYEADLEQMWACSEYIKQHADVDVNALDPMQKCWLKYHGYDLDKKKV